MTRCALGKKAQSGKEWSLPCILWLRDRTYRTHIPSRGWPIQRIVCREYDRELLNRAEENLNHLELSKSFELFDFNSPETNGFEKFDVAFFCHSMHHCTDIERFLTYLNSILNDHGVILGLDYLGPPRLQAAYETKKLMEEIFASLPEHIRANFSKDGKVERDLPCRSSRSAKMAIRARLLGAPICALCCSQRFPL